MSGCVGTSHNHFNYCYRTTFLHGFFRSIDFNLRHFRRLVLVMHMSSHFRCGVVVSTMQGHSETKYMPGHVKSNGFELSLQTYGSMYKSDHCRNIQTVVVLGGFLVPHPSPWTTLAVSVPVHHTMWRTKDNQTETVSAQISQIISWSVQRGQLGKATKRAQLLIT